MPRIINDFENKNNDVFDKIFSDDDSKQKTDLDVLGELFSKKDIKTKTELTTGQIVLINQKRTIAKMLDWKGLDDVLDDFMLLMISKDRKGRGEFVDGFKANRDFDIQKSGGFMGGLKNKLGF